MSFVLLNNLWFINDIVGKYNGTLQPWIAFHDAGPECLLAFGGL